MAARYSTVSGMLLLALLLVNAGLAAYGRCAARQAAPVLARTGALVKTLGLTDLCLFTEASYTRNPSQTDLATPFQDAPLALEHFPTGAMAGPPPHLAGYSSRRLTVYRHGR